MEDDFSYESRLTSDAIDSCMCRRRPCDSPAPANGGLTCQDAHGGFGTEVSNCTQHGQWTDWSDWSACSNSCDVGRRTRKRTCGNPAPAFGGHTCVGRDVDTQFCNDLPPCNSFQSPSAVVTSTDRWSEWSEWSSCSVDCGPGFKSRQRKCYGDACSSGCSKEYDTCENKKCSDQVDVTDWTPWIKINSTQSGWNEKRFRFSYRGSPTIRLNKLGHIEAEQRFCSDETRCVSTSLSRGSSDGFGWSGWSKCTRECGGGYQLKVRYCQPEEKGCNGMTVVEKPCNTHLCSGGEWSCWSEWSSCDRSGRKSRSRDCKSNMVGLHSCTNGVSYEQTDCQDAGWTKCNSDGLQSRWTEGKKELRPCDPKMSPSSSATGLTMGTVVGACICGFIAGFGLGAGLIYYYFRFRKHGGHGAPHYLSAKSNNLYVSLPMLDLKYKSNQSDFDTLRSTSTLRSRAESSIYSAGGAGKLGSGSEYETATIKRSRSQSHRNSALLNSPLRTDLDSDQLFT